MTYGWQKSHGWLVGAGLSLGATVGAVAAFLAPAITPASAEGAKAVPAGTAVATSYNCSASVDGTALGRDAWAGSTNAHPAKADAPAKALDGNDGTRFSTGEYQAAGLYFRVDLGSSKTFNEVSMNVPHSPTDYGRAFVVELSSDGTSWSTVANCTGSGAYETVGFPEHTARYVQVVLTTGVKYWWSIDEFNLYTSDCYAPVAGNALNRASWSASSNTNYSSSDAPALALDGNLSTRFSSNRDEVAGMAYKVDMGAVQTFDELVMATPNSPNDYARVFNVSVSNDGSSWAAVATCKGTSASQVVRFPAQTARFIRVVLDPGTAVHYWWSIDEFNVYTNASVPPPPPPPPTTTTTTTTTVPPRTTPSVSVTPSANPVPLGTAVTYSAVVSPLPEGGAVTFFGNGEPIFGCTDAGLNLQTGDATCSASYSSAGDRTVQAYYSGFGNFNAAASPTFSEAVQLPAPGYWLVTRNGQVYAWGGAQALGNAATSASTGPVVGMAGTQTAHGYWVVTATGTVMAFGDAKFYGDLPDLNLHVSDIVAIAPTTDGKGYYLVGADGGFFTFGDAKFHGSIPGIHIHVKDIVGMVATPGGAGYLLVGANGGVFTFGQSRFYGSLPGIHKHVSDIMAILPSSTATGYVLVGADGGAFVFGSGVRFYGSLPDQGVRVSNVVGIALTPDDGGYFMAGADGHVYGFGNAHAGGTPAGLSSNLPVAAIAGT
jgi:F5/8 type C domain/Bacterial Ig-like domain (group 3)